MQRSRMAPWPAVFLSGLLVGPGPARAEPLDGAAAWRALVGNTVVATTKGGGYTDFFEEGGGIRHSDQDGKTSGQWTVEGDTVCLDFPDDDERVCVRPHVDGTNGSFRDPDGTEDAFTIMPGNAKGL